MTHWAYHWMPWVLMPRSWIGRPYRLQSLVPQTRSWPLIAAGVVPPPPPGAVVTLTWLLAADRLPAASRARTVKLYAVDAASPPTVPLVPVTVVARVPPR